MGCPGHVVWATGWDGLLARIIQEAGRDWKLAVRMGRTEAKENAQRKSCARKVQVCRFAMDCGFETPAQGLAAFFESEVLHSWIRLCNIDPIWYIAEIGYRG